MMAHIPATRDDTESVMSEGTFLAMSIAVMTGTTRVQRDMLNVRDNPSVYSAT